MNMKGIGFTVHGPSIEGDLKILETRLDSYKEMGVEYLELPTHGLDIILNGQFQQSRLEEVMEILSKYPFKYSVHPANDLNLMDTENIGIQRDLFLRNLEFSHRIGAEVLVYHSGVRLPRDEHRPLEELMEFERNELIKMADRAAELGVNISVENHNPNPEDVRSEEINKYGLFLDRLYEQVNLIDHSHVGICLDYGHAFLSANYYQFDFLKETEKIMDRVNHVHVHDNFGIVTQEQRPYVYQYNFGEGDLHLPIGWGKIPYQEIFNRDSKPVICLVELRPRFMRDTGKCVEDIKRFLKVTKEN
jgi:sugar phosphate isomerase/epimerase